MQSSFLCSIFVISAQLTVNPVLIPLASFHVIILIVRLWLSGGMQAWRTSGEVVEMLDEIAVRDLKSRLDAGEIEVLDVRQPAEWAEGHVPGAQFITGAELPARLGELDARRPTAVICGSGYRSAVVSSLLQARGHEQVHNVIGGMSAWNNAGLPTSKE